MSKKNETKPLKQPAVSNSASTEPDFRTNQSGRIVTGKQIGRAHV